MKNGYRHIDTAAGYQNETEVGQGIKASGVPREQIFLTTKLDNPDQRNPTAALESSLKKLDTPYIDLCMKPLFLYFPRKTLIRRPGLMHWPAPMTQDGKADKGHDWLDTWKAMEDLYNTYPDKLKAIGE